MPRVFYMEDVPSIPADADTSALVSAPLWTEIRSSPSPRQSVSDAKSAVLPVGFVGALLVLALLEAQSKR